MVTQTWSMKYPQYHQIPKDAKVRFLDPDFLEPLKMFHEFDINCEHCKLEETKHSERIMTNETNPFAPFPFTSQRSIEEMDALARMRSMINVVEVRMQQLPTPVRKKKSWLRYSSNKKWARKATKRFIRKVGYVQVLSVPKSLMDKIAALKNANPLDAAFMNPRPAPKRRG